MSEFVQTLISEPLAFLDQTVYRVLAVLIGLCCHEWGHAYAAYLCGDDTAKRAGRLTLNPLAHLDPVGALLMFFAGFGWAKPVPVNPWRFKGDRVKCDFLVSIAGISVNLVLFLLFTVLTIAASLFLWAPEVIAYNGVTALVSYEYNVIWSVISGTGQAEFGALMVNPWLMPVVRLCAYTALVNINLAVFNLLPLPPLDGYHVVNDLIFRGRFQLSRKVFQIGMIIVLVLSAKGVLGRIIYAVVFPAQRLLLMPAAAIWG